MELYLHSILRFRGLCSKKDINFNFQSSRILTSCITKGAWCGFTMFRTEKLCNISDVTCETHRNSAAHLADSPTHTQSQRLSTSLVIYTLPQQRFVFCTSGYWQYFSLAALTFWKIMTIATERPGLSKSMDSLLVEEFKTRQNPCLQEEQLRVIFKVKYTGLLISP
jgi:hypothetical protein